MKELKPKKLPYEGTKIDPYKSMAEISRLLENAGALGIQWTSLFNENKVSVAFILDTEIDGVQKQFTAKIDAPYFAESKRIYNPKTLRTEKTIIPNWSRSLRIMFWYIKSKIEAVQYGLVSAEREFLSNIAFRLPSGMETTVGNLIGRKAVDGTLALPGASEPQTEEEKRRAIDVEATST